MKYKLVFSYDGTNYFGYAKQVDKITVQATLEKTLNIIFNEDITLKASGRTDKGVHALGQVATFEALKEKDCSKLKISLNKLLPDDIYVLEIENVPEEFDARFSSKSKTYIYRILVGESNPFERDHCLFVNSINFEKIVEICGVFVGKHCFKNFCSKEEDDQNFARNIFSITPQIKDNEIIITFEGDGFMRYQIRKIVGTILEFQKGKISKEKIIEYLTKDERDIIPFTAPPQGLYLKEVKY